MRMIATRCNISLGLTYHYFVGKEALFSDITERDGDITTVSAAVRRIAEAYAELYGLPADIRAHFADQCYYFNLPVRREHGE